MTDFKSLTARQPIGREGSLYISILSQVVRGKGRMSPLKIKMRIKMRLRIRKENRILIGNDMTNSTVGS